MTIQNLQIERQYYRDREHSNNRLMLSLSLAFCLMVTLMSGVIGTAVYFAERMR